MKEYFLNLFRYEIWANKKVAESLTGIDDPPEKALSLMSHIINAQVVWLCRITGKTYDINSVWKTLAKADITGDLNNSSDALTGFILSLAEDDLEKIIDYTNIKGERFKSFLKDILTHLSVHSAYHRGQVILLLKPVLNVLPSTDYIIFVRESNSLKNKN